MRTYRVLTKSGISNIVTDCKKDSRRPKAASKLNEAVPSKISEGNVLPLQSADWHLAAGTWLWRDRKDQKHDQLYHQQLQANQNQRWA